MSRLHEKYVVYFYLKSIFNATIYVLILIIQKSANNFYQWLHVCKDKHGFFFIKQINFIGKNEFILIKKNI